MKLRNKLIATIVSICMVLAVVGIGAWASVESFTASITNTVNLEFDNLKGQISVQAMSGADNLEPVDEPSMQEVLYDGSNVIYNQISSNATNGTNLYWEGTRFLDTTEDGMQVVDNETEAAVFGYLFQYSPTEACTGMSTITAMITETALPEISGGKLMVKYFATTDMLFCTEIESGEAITPIRDNEMLVIVAVCQYYNLDGESITSVASAWNFNVTFTSGRNEKTALPGGAIIDVDPSDGIVLAYNYTSPGESRWWEIIEFGEYPQTLKANDVTITSETPDADGYYPGSDGERYHKYTLDLGSVGGVFEQIGALTADNGEQMKDGETYYFKVEPIKWRVLSVEDGASLVVTDKVIQHVVYQSEWQSGAANGWTTTGNGAPEGTPLNNYYYSDLRKFLNEDFYNKFSATEKQKILVTNVDNSASTTNSADNPYACENTDDFVFALSYADMLSSGYGFSSNPDEMDAARAWGVTDFAKATGVWMITQDAIEILADMNKEVSESMIGSAVFVCTRSPSEKDENDNVSPSHISVVDGWAMNLCQASNVDGVWYGVAPAMRITR